LGVVLPVSEAQALATVGRGAVDAFEGLQATGVDEFKFGEIDNETHRAGRVCVNLAV